MVLFLGRVTCGIKFGVPKHSELESYYSLVERSGDASTSCCVGELSAIRNIDVCSPGGLLLIKFSLNYPIRFHGRRHGFDSIEVMKSAKSSTEELRLTT